MRIPASVTCAAAAACLSLAFAGVAIAVAPPLSAPFLAYPTVGGPTQVVTADFDHDGRTDVALTCTSSNMLEVMMGHADGSYGPPVQYSRSGLVSVATGDFDGDGWTDLVVGRASEFDVLRNTGTGAFVAGSTVQTQSVCKFIATADFNGDGRSDVLTGPGTISVFINNGTGGFLPPVVVANNAITTHAAVIGDFDGDGALDIIFDSGSSWFVHGHGDGTFASRVPVASAFGYAAADVNEDGKLDLLNVYNVYLGNGDGTFGTAIPLTNKTLELGTPVGVTPGDIDGDGHIDLVEPFYYGSAPYATQFATFHGDGHGGFAPAVMVTTGQNPMAIALAPAVAGGPTCAFVAADVTNALAVHVFGGGTTFPLPPTALFGQIRAAVTADFDLDGRTDVAILDYCAISNMIQIRRNNGTAAMGPIAGYIPAGQNSNWTFSSLAAGDVTGDGYPDLLFTRNNTVAPPPVTLQLGVLPGVGDGTFGAPIYITVGWSSVGGVSVGDFNEDGMLDVAVGQNGPPGTAILLSQGNGVFAAPVVLPEATTGGGQLVDINEDGHLDLISGHVWLGDGTGGFVQSALTPYPGTYADLNGDGHLDRVVVQPYGFSTLLGNGTDTFGAQRNYGTGVRGDGLQVADLDGDGRLDVAQGAGNTTAIFFGNGDGSMTAALGHLGAGGAPLPPIDLTGNGKLDLITDAGPWVHLNPGSLVSVPAGPRAIAIRFAAAPNPARTTATLRWALPVAGHVTLHVYDVSGRRVTTLADAASAAGAHETRWDLTRPSGERVRSGVYFAELRAAGMRVTRRIAVTE